MIATPNPPRTFGREVEMQVLYKGIHVGTRRVDFLIEDKICVELKALISSAMASAGVFQPRVFRGHPFTSLANGMPG